jgi:hypothetical protein
MAEMKGTNLEESRNRHRKVTLFSCVMKVISWYTNVVGSSKVTFGDYSPVYSHLKAGELGSIVIRTIEENPSDHVRHVWHRCKSVTVFGQRIRKVSNGLEFREVWIIILGTWDVFVYTICYILIIRDPWDISDTMHIVGVWTVVDRNRSWKNVEKKEVNITCRTITWD